MSNENLNRKEQPMTSQYEQIEALNKRSPREEEIAALCIGNYLPAEFRAEFRRLEYERDEAGKKAITAAWETLQRMGYEKYDVRGNAAYESGHSDYIEASENYVSWGVKAPDGTKFPGSATWTEGILPAIKHANL